MEAIEKYLRERIKQLRETEIFFREQMLDRNKAENIRNISRQQSNAISIAIEELETCLTVLGLPIKEEENAKSH